MSKILKDLKVKRLKGLIGILNNGNKVSLNLLPSVRTAKYCREFDNKKNFINIAAANEDGNSYLYFKDSFVVTDGISLFANIFYIEYTGKK